VGKAKYLPTVMTGPGAHTAFYLMGVGSFQGMKRPGHGVDHPPTSSAEVKERDDLCLYSLRGLFYGELYLYLILFFYFSAVSFLSFLSFYFLTLFLVKIISIPFISFF
jgi:hypothetical protein